MLRLVPSPPRLHSSVPPSPKEMAELLSKLRLKKKVELGQESVSVTFLAGPRHQSSQRKINWGKVTTLQPSSIIKENNIIYMASESYNLKELEIRK